MGFRVNRARGRNTRGKWLNAADIHYQTAMNQRDEPGGGCSESGSAL